MPRRKRVPDERVVRLEVTMTEDEHATLKAFAQAIKQSMARVVRDQAVGAAKEFFDERRLAERRRDQQDVRGSARHGAPREAATDPIPVHRRAPGR